MPFIPTNRDERHSFRGTTRIRRFRRSLKALLRSQSLTESPGALYLSFKGQLMGESPALHIRGSHHPALSEMQTNVRQPNHSFYNIKVNVTIFPNKKQVFFHN